LKDGHLDTTLLLTQQLYMPRLEHEFMLTVPWVLWKELTGAVWLNRR